MVGMEKQWRTLRVTDESLRLLQRISEHTGQKQYRIIERLLQDEAQKCEERSQNGAHHGNHDSERDSREHR